MFRSSKHIRIGINLDGKAKQWSFYHFRDFGDKDNNSSYWKFTLLGQFARTF